MSAELRFRAEVTAAFLERAEPRAVALLVWWTEQWNEVTRTRRRVPLRVVRWTGFGLSLLAIGLTGYLIVVTPDVPCRAGSLRAYNALMPFFVLCATVFGFLGRIEPAIQAWNLRVAARQAKRLIARTRRAAPMEVEYVVAEGRLTGRSERPRLLRVTELRRVERAAFAGEVACLYGGRFPGLVKRLVWIPDPAAGSALQAALRAAGVGVVDLP